VAQNPGANVEWTDDNLTVISQFRVSGELPVAIAGAKTLNGPFVVALCVVSPLGQLTTLVFFNNTLVGNFGSFGLVAVTPDSHLLIGRITNGQGPLVSTPVLQIGPSVRL
jgi:hypothetical protein